MEVGSPWQVVMETGPALQEHGAHIALGGLGAGVSRCEMTMARRSMGGLGSGQVGWTQDFGV